MTTNQQPLSDERVKELKELYAKATPGEWHVQPISEQGREYRNKSWATLTGPKQWNGSNLDHYEDPTFLDTNEAAFIVALHNAFPSLIHAAEMAKQFQWRDIASAPRDGTLVLLRVESDTENWTPLEDSMEYTTLGSNSHNLNDIDEWTFAGWCWSHDHYTEGRGKPVAWMPLPPAPETKGGVS